MSYPLNPSMTDEHPKISGNYLTKLRLRISIDI